ncbi:DNA ligase, partial [Halorubrum saccharovorum]
MEFAAFADRAEALAAEPADIETTGLSPTCSRRPRGLTVAPATRTATAPASRATTSRWSTRFLLGRVFPAHDTRTLDVGPALCREAIARAAGPNVTAADVEKRLAEAGEIGAVAAGFEFGGQRGPRRLPAEGRGPAV